jgi:hypothetical protein
VAAAEGKVDAMKILIAHGAVIDEKTNVTTT